MAKWIAKSKEQYAAGVKQMMDNIQHRLRMIRFELFQEVATLGLNALSFSIAKAPLDQGDLMGNAFLEINGSVVAVGFMGGGGAVEVSEDATFMRIRVVFPEHYALIQHEHPEFYHPMGGQAFFLEAGFAEAVSQFLSSISAFK